MNLKILLPHEIFLEEPVSKVVAEALDGSFGLLPRHLDFVSALAPGLLSYLRPDDHAEIFVAVDEGVLVKQGTEVLVSTGRAVRSNNLGELRATVKNEFLTRTDEERRARSAMAHLESALARRFIEFQRHA